MSVRTNVKLLAVASLLLIAAAPDDAADYVQGSRDVSHRMTVPVTLNGAGPYQFVVDTAAERTVISRELAGRLALADGGSAQVISITGQDTVDTALVPQLQLSASRQSLLDLRAPIMAEVHLGASGLLGIDSLRTKRVVLDFKAMRLTIVDAARPPKPDSDEIVVTARRKLGQLIMVDAQANGQKISVVIDTGSQVTVGNPALRKQLERRKRLGRVIPIEILSVTGGKTMADYTTIARAKIGGVEIADLPVAFADARIFHRLGLSDKPAMLLGMDVLRSFDRVSVDYANKSVRFLLPGDTFQAIPVLASAPIPHAG